MGTITSCIQPVFVDDYSLYTWFYSLRAKSEFYSLFVGFQKLVKNQLPRKIKVFQSDGGGEFVNRVLATHLGQHGIKHLFSCPHTPQQNGTPERKHIHLVVLGLSMIFHSHVPLKYWVEAFNTANFIINMLLSTTLKDKSPHETLFHAKLDYSMLQVLGSACYPCLRSMSSYKLEPRSLQRVFLGYGNHHKGYRCLHPSIGKVYISPHVVFDEETLPFKGQYKYLVPSYDSPLLKAWQMSSPTTSVSSPDQLSLALVPPVVPPQPTPPPLVPVQTEQVVPVHQQATPVIQNAENNTHPMNTRAKVAIHKPNTR